MGKKFLKKVFNDLRKMNSYIDKSEKIVNRLETENKKIKQKLWRNNKFDKLDISIMIISKIFNIDEKMVSKYLVAFNIFINVCNECGKDGIEKLEYIIQNTHYDMNYITCYMNIILLKLINDYDIKLSKDDIKSLEDINIYIFQRKKKKKN